MLTEFLKDAHPKERSVVLLFDAMYVNKHVEYNAFDDRVHGVEDVGDGSRTPSFAQCLLVFMVRGIIGGWTEVIGHHFTKASFPKESLKKLLMSYPCALESASIECHAIICDQEPAHVSLFKSLGVTRSTPYIRCPFSDRSVFVMYDPPHLIKSTGNNLLLNDFMVRSHDAS